MSHIFEIALICIEVIVSQNQCVACDINLTFLI